MFSQAANKSKAAKKNARRHAAKRANIDENKMNMWAGPLCSQTPYKLLQEEYKRARRPTIDEIVSSSTRMDAWWLITAVEMVSMIFAVYIPDNPNIEGMSADEREEGKAIWNHPVNQRKRFCLARLFIVGRKITPELRDMVAVQRWWNSCAGISYCTLPDIDSMSDDALVEEIKTDNERIMNIKL